MRKTFVNVLRKEARQNERIFLLTPDLGYSVLEEFADEFPDRFLNVGIAEQNAVGIAAGLALSGYIVYIYSIIPFVTMRCFEQIRVDAAYMNTNIRLIGVGAGLSYGPAGATHHAIEDIAIMRALPNMTVCCPGELNELQQLVQASFVHQGPMYFRLGKADETVASGISTEVVLGKAKIVVEGTDFAVITTSNMLPICAGWIEEWRQRGAKGLLLSMPTIKPIDKSTIEKILERDIPVITVEEHSVIGGLGSCVAEIIAESGRGVVFKRFGIQDHYVHQVGSEEYLCNLVGLNRHTIEKFLVERGVVFDS